MSPDFQKKRQELDRLLEQAVKTGDDWQNTFDSIPDLICVLDTDARIIRVNRSFSERLHKPSDTLIGSRCVDVIHASPMPPITRLFTSVLTAGQAAQPEQDVEIGGSLFTALLFPLYDAAGELRGAVHIFRDITEKKTLSDQLTQSEKMAAIGTLAAEMAHEINNPLHYINNYLYLLYESLPPDFAKREYVDNIQTGVDNLAQLTRDLLEFSRSQTELFLPVDLRDIVKTSLEFCDQRIRESHVRVVRHDGPRESLVMGSERMLQQVFINLIQNALDALTPGGCIILTTSRDGERCAVECEDTGAGIEAKNIARIFEPFFTTKKSFERRGTGLGLSICYNIIKQHNGDIAVSSKEGQGTKFTISLPAAS